MMTGIALREGALRPSESLFVSLSLLLLSLTASVRCCFLQCGAWPHVNPTSSTTQVPSVFYYYYDDATLRFTDCQNCNGVRYTDRLTLPEGISQWEFFFNGVPAGTCNVVEAMCMNSSILSLPMPTNENALIKVCSHYRERS